MTREEFLEQFVLSRTSHKRSIEDLLIEAEKAWSYVHP